MIEDHSATPGWYRLCGLSAILLAACYLIIFPLYFRAGAPPAGADAWFRYLPGKTNLWWTIIAISVFTDFLFVPVTLALYLALRQQARNVMLLASAFVAAFILLDLAVTWTHYPALISLYEKYAATPDPALRGRYLAAADYASAVLTSPVEIVYSIVTLSTGILLIGLVMLRGRFSRATAWMGIITGILGILSLSRLTFAIIGNALCATLWLLLSGIGLCRMKDDAG